MATYTITTTDDQEVALARSFELMAPPPLLAGMPPGEPPATQEAYLQQQVDVSVLNPMVQQYRQAANKTLIETLSTVPLENRPAARAEMEQVILDHGGTLPEDGSLSDGIFSLKAPRPVLPPPPPMNDKRAR